YPGGDRFISWCEKYLQKVYELCENNLKVTRAGLRFVNAFTFQEHEINDINDLEVKLEAGGKKIEKDFLLSYVIENGQNRTLIRVGTTRFVSGAHLPENFSIMVDLDVAISDGSVLTSCSDVVSWLHQARNCKNEAYR